MSFFKQSLLHSEADHVSAMHKLNPHRLETQSRGEEDQFACS